MKIKDFLKYLSFIIVIIAVFPVIKFVSYYLILLLIISFIISLKFEFQNRWILNFIGIITIIVTFFRISSSNLVIPIIEAIIILLSIKFLENKKYRDYMQIYLLSIFIAAGYSLLTVKLSYLFYIFLLLILLTISGIFLTFFNEDEELAINRDLIFNVSLNSIFIFLLSIPLAMTIFIILPRVKSPLFDYLNQEKVALSGFSDKLTLGDVNKIQIDNSVIFRAVMKKIPEKNLYWRGIVLDYFDGKTWINSGKIKEKISNIKTNGLLVKQTIYLEPYYSKYLFTLDKPVLLNLKKATLNGLIYAKYPENIKKRIKYTVYSIISESSYQKKIKKEIYLQLPQDISPKIIKLAKNFKSINDIRNYFIKSKFIYSTKDIPISSHPVEDFLFKYKKGNCEYFASTFALLLRLMNIPSRIVAGYKGGIYSNLGNYYIVSQKDAHVWVEAYLNNYWIRIDPTIFSFTPLKQLKIKQNKIEKKNSYLIKVKLYIDLINFYWIKFVINYNFEKQLKLFYNITTFNQSFLKKILKLIFFFLSSGFLIFLFIKYYKKEETLILEKFLKKLQKAGVKVDKNLTLREIASTIKNKELKLICYDFINTYESIYYHDKKFTKKDIKKLKKILNYLDNII